MTTAELTLKSGDTYPSVEATLSVNGALLNLTGATVTFVMAKNEGDGGAVFEKPAVIVGSATDATVRYDWDAEDTATSGRYLGEFRVLLAGGFRTTVPNTDYIAIRVTKSLPSPA